MTSTPVGTTGSNSCWYYRLPADSYATIGLGEQEEAPVKDAVISGPTSAQTDRKICLCNFDENTTTPSTQFCMDSEAK